MRRIDLLRARKPHPGGHPVGDPYVHDKHFKNDDLLFFQWPSAETIWFVCDAGGRPFPRSGCDHKSGAITMFLASLDLPSHHHDPKTGERFCHSTDEPERSRWWQWFKNRGFNLQNFEVNPAPEKPKEIMEILKYQLRFERQRSDGCVWCKGAERFRIIAARLHRMVEAIDYYSVRPEEQKRWLESMNELWAAKRGRTS